jgi:hypothetical protein
MTADRVEACAQVPARVLPSFAQAGLSIEDRVRRVTRVLRQLHGDADRERVLRRVILAAVGDVRAQRLAMIRDVIDLLAQTRRSFKSKQVGHARNILEMMLEIELSESRCVNRE